MYRLTVYGTLPSDLRTLVTVVREIPGQCELSWVRDLISEQHEKPLGYQPRKLLEAIPGIYPLWHETYGTDLVVTSTAVILDGRVVTTRQDPLTNIVIPEAVLRGFGRLLTGTTTRVAIYEYSQPLGNGLGQEYMFVNAGMPPEPRHKVRPGMTCVAVLDPSTGHVESYTAEVE